MTLVFTGHGRGGQRVEEHAALAFDGVKRTVRQQSMGIVIIPPPGVDGLAVRNQFEAMNGDHDKAVQAGIAARRLNIIRSAYDGTRFCQIGPDPKGLAAYKDFGSGTAGLMFNPRLLGVGNSYTTEQDPKLYFATSDTKALAVVGEEMIGGRKAWHIQADLGRHPSVGDRKRHFWIEDQAPFRIHKVECVSDIFRSTVASEYDRGVEGGVLPVRVNNKEYVRGKLEDESEVTVTKMELNEPVDPRVGTLASLDLPIGKTVQDHIRQKTVGYWNGEELSPDPHAAAEINRGRKAMTLPFGQTGQGSRRMWIWVGVGGLVAYLGITVFLRWRQRRMPAQAATVPLSQRP